MPTIVSQLKELRKLINIPYKIVFVDREIKPEEFWKKRFTFIYGFREIKMSFIDFFKDVIKQPFNVGKSILGAITGGGGNDDMRRMMNEQMKAYKNQTELTRKELERTRGEADAQKRRIQEKQIRALRRNYRPQGLLGVGEPASSDMSSSLGA